MDEWAQTSLAVHRQRYRFAASYAANRRVLDLACGIGYGSRILKNEGGASEVVGLDAAPDAIDYARRHYSSEGISFACAEYETFSDPAPFGLVCSLETIEHVPDPDDFLIKISSLIEPGGIFVASVPVTVSTDSNPHHLHDFTHRSFKRLLERHGFHPFEQLEQRFAIRYLGHGRVSEALRRVDKLRLVAYYARHPLLFGRRMVELVRYGPTNVVLCVAARYRRGNSLQSSS